MCLKLCVPDQTIDIRPRKMSKFFRFFSRRRTGRGVKSDQTDHGHPLKKKNAVQCTVMLLDGTDFSTELHVSPMNIISCFEMRYPRNYGIYHVYIQYDIFNTAGQSICWHIIKYWLFSWNHISYFFINVNIRWLYSNQFQFNMKFMICHWIILQNDQSGFIFKLYC